MYRAGKRAAQLMRELQEHTGARQDEPLYKQIHVLI